ncbi:hypothetical protein S40285_08277 [Stachybotrys chlorohalonatus IBT 40285]|uniref:Heterokaryon incompatibility domain-containing protein n=1 Tax=Stachybotrys chlorohalonatus (strain IBT 40285) TaxID=1283841 RepID=A0A084QRL1_STAC4|nr:hypothetical protein S40285_08277 [Stachybotrys chlorohalonata IBT 40285]
MRNTHPVIQDSYGGESGTHATSTLPQPHSCQYCQQLRLDFDWRSSEDDPRYRVWNATKNRQTEVLGSNEYPFKFTFSDLLRAAKHGCDLSVNLLRRPSRREEDFELSRDQLPPLANFDQRVFGHWELAASIGNCSDEESAGPDMTTIYFQLVCPDDLTRYGMGHREVILIDDGIHEAFDIMAEASNPAAKWVSKRPVNAIVNSEFTFSHLQTTLNICRTSHERCSKSQLSWIPTRLLHVPKAPTVLDTVRLVETKLSSDDRHRHYAALSYCWGGDQAIKCTRESLGVLSQGIPLGDLPLTIRDAALVCQKMDLQYLWVDALCILQDDEEDKGREIGQMARIYSAATFTILAARAPAAAYGFLHPRMPQDVFSEFALFSLPYRANASAEYGAVILCRLNSMESPLITRGWAFQEQFLSIRRIWFDCHRTSWSCRESGFEDHSLQGWKPLSSNSDGEPGVQTMLRVSDAWRNCVVEYSSRNLTIATDRILAISGVAEKYGSLMECRYLAGIWETSACLDLLWMPYPGFEMGTHLKPRPTSYQGPTFSWVSIQAPISYFPTTQIGHDVRKEIIDRAIDPHTSNSHQRLLPAMLRLATLQSHTVSPLFPESPYGAVKPKAAYITVQGRTLLARMQPHPHPDRNDYRYANAAYIDSRHNLPSGVFVTVKPDTSDDLLGHLGSCTTESLHVTLIEVVSTVDLDRDGSYVWKCWGLVLLDVTSRTRYRRVGSFYHKGEVHLWQSDVEVRRRERLDWFKGEAPIVVEIE